MKKNKAVGFYFAAIAAVLSVVGVVLYGSVMYRYTPVYYMLGAAIAVAVIGLGGTLAMGHKALFSAVPVINAALSASAAVWAASLMVNQIGYVIAGLDDMSTINSWIVFMVITVAAMLLNIIASFLPMAKEA